MRYDYIEHPRIGGLEIRNTVTGHSVFLQGNEACDVLTEIEQIEEMDETGEILEDFLSAWEDVMEEES